MIIYKCSKCDAENCKLWRQYNTCTDYIELMCCICACKDQKQDYSKRDKEGKGGKYNSDQIGGLVPAVPTEDKETYWGYTSVPQDLCVWWKKLPTLPSPKNLKECNG
jgi:hypothetical protein